MNREDRGQMYIDFIHYSRRGAFEVANALYDLLVAEKLVASPADDDETLMGAGLLALFDGQDAVRAANAFEQVLAANPGHLGALYQLSVALDRMGAESAGRLTWQKTLERAEQLGDAATSKTARDRLARADSDTEAGLMSNGLRLLYQRRAPAGLSRPSRGSSSGTRLITAPPSSSPWRSSKRAEGRRARGMGAREGRGREDRRRPGAGDGKRPARGARRALRRESRSAIHRRSWAAARLTFCAITSMQAR